MHCSQAIFVLKMTHIEWQKYDPYRMGNLSIHSIHLKPKKDPFPSKLCSHIPSRMDPSQTPGVSVRAQMLFHIFNDPISNGISINESIMSRKC